MFYNTENLFDTRDDSTKDDNEFLPAGLRRWNQTRYRKKISAVYKTIMAAGDWRPPAIVGLCEVENRKVLEDLVAGTYLSNYGYGIIHEDSPDSRGIDVALIFRKDLVKIREFRSWIPPANKVRDFRSRSVLYARCELYQDTIHLIINHWPSRRGGVLSGESLRYDIAEMVRSAADSINGISSGQAKIIIMGDFNCTPDDPVIKELTRTEVVKSGLHLINLTRPGNPPATGTYKYMGTWELLDQIIVSSPLLNSNSGLFTVPGNFRVFNTEFLLGNDLSYPGPATFSTYKGYSYRGGFSDHLPVLLDLVVR